MIRDRDADAEWHLRRAGPEHLPDRQRSERRARNCARERSERHGRRKRGRTVHRVSIRREQPRARRHERRMGRVPARSGGARHPAPEHAAGRRPVPESDRFAGDLDDARRPLRRVRLGRSDARAASFGDTNNAADVFVFDAQSLILQRMSRLAATPPRCAPAGERPHRVADAERRWPLRLGPVRGLER